jgi:hypothetical protein
MQVNAAYIRPKVVESFSGLCASSSYVHQAAHLIVLEVLAVLNKILFSSSKCMMDHTEDLLIAIISVLFKTSFI